MPLLAEKVEAALQAKLKAALREPSNAVLALILAVAAASLVYLTWGGLDRPGLYHDEKAYLLQARIFADLKFAEPSPPVPGLWEQIHVFVTPHYASKYPPGFPAVLALGAAVGLPGLVPVLATVATAVLLFLFGAKLIGRWTSFIATALWLSAPHNITWRAAYFSESLTGLLWVAWCYTAWRYRKHGQVRDLVFTSLLVAFAAITRPVTAIALCLPVPFIIWPRLRDLTRWRATLVAGSAGLVFCAIVPFWNHGVLDSWTTVPYSAYSARTFPFDMPGMKTNWSPPLRELPPDIQALGDEQRQQYEHRAVGGLPRTFIQRADVLAAAALPSKFRSLRYLAPLGLLAAGGAGVVALASCLLLLLAHLTMPQPINWTIYYLDVYPAVAFGVVLALKKLLELTERSAPHAPSLMKHRHAMAIGTGCVLMVAAGTVWRPLPVDHNGWMFREIYFRSGVCALPPGPKIVFVNPRLGSSPHHNLVDNDPRWEKSPLWIVRDWGAERAQELLRAAPARAAYYYDEHSGWFNTMTAAGVAGGHVLHVVAADHQAGRGIACPAAREDGKTGR